MEKIGQYQKAVKLKFSLFISLFFLALIPVFGQEEEKKPEIGAIGTDRPVQSETPTTVPKKYIQFELGGQYTLNYPNATTIKDEAYNGNILLKYGLFESMELRISTNYIQENRTIQDLTSFPPLEEEKTTSGIDAPVLGFKFSLLKEEGWKPNISYSLQSQVPIWGETEFKNTDQNFLNRITIGKTLAGNWYGIVGIQYGYYPTGQSDFFYVVQTGYTFFDKLTAIAEFYGYSTADDDPSTDALNFALVYLLNDNHQVDLSGGTGLSDNFYDYYLAIGYSFRFHH